MATHSSILAWRIPGTTEPSMGFSIWLPSMGSHRVGHDWSDAAAAAAAVAQTVKILPEMREISVQILGQEEILEKGTHSSIIAWEIPWREEPGGLQHMGSQKVGHDWVTNTFTLLHDILPQVKVSSEFQICIHKYFILLYGSLKIANIMYPDSQALA